MPEINSINIGGISYSLGGGGSGDSAAIEDIKKLLFPSITTVGEEGTPVTFTKGDRVLTKIPDESGVVTEYLPELGTWTVETEIGGVEFEQNLELNTLNKKVNLELVFSKKSATSLSSNKNGLSATTLGNYAIFGGTSSTDVYNTSLVRSSPTSLSKSFASTASNGTYALFGGGVLE